MVKRPPPQRAETAVKKISMKEIYVLHVPGKVSNKVPTITVRADAHKSIL